MQSDMVYHPAMGFLAHSIVHSVFILVHSCQWSFTMVVVSVASSSSVASFATYRYAETSDITSIADTLRNVTAGEVFLYQSIFKIPSM